MARREYYVVQGSADTGLENEVVGYDTPAHAGQALTQWFTAAATCPHGRIHSAVGGVPNMRITVTRNLQNTTTLPATANVVTEETAVSPHDGTFYLLAIMQVYKRYLDAVYLVSPSPITTAESDAVAALAIVTGRRLVVQD